jgi:flagellar hook-length control protein FliK
MFSNAMTAEIQETTKFSEYLAALDKKLEGADEDAPVRDEEPAATVENGTDDEEKTAAAENIVVKHNYLMEIAGVAHGEAEAADTAEVTVDAEALPVDTVTDTMAVTTDTAALPAYTGDTDGLKDAGIVDVPLFNKTAEEPVLRLAEALPSPEKSGAAGEVKTPPLDSDEKTETAPKESGGIKLFNASDGIYIDEKTPEIETRLAGDAGAEEAGAEIMEKAAPSNKKNAALKADGGNTLAPAAEDYTGTTGVLVQTAAREKSGYTRSDGEKKPNAERAKRNMAGGRVEASGPAHNGAAEGAAPVREAVRVSAAPEAEITVNLRGGEPRNAAAGEQGGGAGGMKPAASFETFLARELNQNLNGDIVRQAQVLLREGGEGTIRLSLKPESLGKVKIRLEMAENKITGKIVVESGEALRAFEHEMESLEQTFRGEGFDGASLSLELAEHQEPGGGEDGWRRPAAYAKRPFRVGSNVLNPLPGAGGVYFGTEYTAKQVNVLV